MPAPVEPPLALGTSVPQARPVEPGARALYDLPEYYDQEFSDRSADVDFYRALVQLLGIRRVLELGVGSGRIALPLAADGVSTVGIDTSRPMLQRLGERLAAAQTTGATIETHCLDMRDARLGERFELVTAPFNAMLHLYDRQDVETFLATVTAHLSPTGLFAFDYSAPRAADLALDPQQWQPSGEANHPKTGARVSYAERFDYDPSSQRLQMSLRFGEGPDGLVVPLSHRQFFPAEMNALLHYNGFVHQRWLGDFEWGPPDGQTDSLVVICGRGGPLNTSKIFDHP